MLVMIDVNIKVIMYCDAPSILPISKNPTVVLPAAVNMSFGKSRSFFF